MPRFVIRNPYFILVVCLIVSVIGITGLAVSVVLAVFLVPAGYLLVHRTEHQPPALKPEPLR
ncbi:MAG: hypothetical protein IT160_08100 [Bryobacterales bacterium]|nr:hypothetical protein [Bryobacterales bacterium]